MNKIFTITALCLMAWLTSCSTSSEFTIEAQLDGVPDGIVTIAYSSDDGMVADRVKLTEGNRVKYVGASQQYTLLWIWNTQGQLIAQMVVRDGDEITVKSDGLQLPTIDIRGNELTEQWMSWRKANIHAINSSDRSAIDKLIEKQIADHPDQLLSTVLLVAEYSQLDNPDKVRPLLQAISPDARPRQLVATLEAQLQPQRAVQSLSPMTLYRHNKGFDELDTQGKNAVILLWSKADDSHKACLDSMRLWAKQRAGQIMLADILVDADTAQWTRTVGAETAHWTHWWAPGGIMDNNLVGLGITRTPTLICTDSTGRVQSLGRFGSEAVKIP